VAVSLALAGAGRAYAAEGAAAGAGAARLHILSVLDDDVTDWIVSGFTAATGIEVERPLGKRSSLEGFTYLEERRGPPEVSVVLGGPGVVWTRAAQNQLLEPYASPELAGFEVPADPGNRWFGVYRGTIAFVTRTDSGLTPPRSWSDLLRVDGPPVKIALANPSTSGTAFTVLSSLVALMGEDAAFRYLTELDHRVVEYPSAGGAVVALVSEGVANVGLAFDHDVEREILRGAPLAISYPEDGTGAEIGGVGIVRDAPEPLAARRFVDYLLSQGFQDRLASDEVALFEPLRRGAAAQRWRAGLPEPKRVALDPVAVAASQRRLLDRWNGAVLAQRAADRATDRPASVFAAPAAHPGTGVFGGATRAFWLDVLAVVLALGIYTLLRRRTSLLPRFLVLVLLSVLVTALGIERFSVRLERDAIQERRRLQARTATELLAEESAVDLLARNVTALAGRVEKLFRYFPGELMDVEISNAAGARVLHAVWRDSGGGGRVEWLERGVRSPVAVPRPWWSAPRWNRSSIPRSATCGWWCGRRWWPTRRCAARCARASSRPLSSPPR
jgi:iron(III) transport system substrate-binding protein